MSTTLTLRLEEEVKDRLDRRAESTQRSKSRPASEAICEFVANSEWQTSAIRAAQKEANSGDFASERNVAILAKKWNVNAG